ncbi:MAG TPA: hypothetical protein GX513_09725 [Firmicutes bacterium]|nr:hypothetical protein [Bacillota bacterium]
MAIGGLGAVLLAAGGLVLAILVSRGGAAGGAKRGLSPAYLAAGVAGLVVVGVLVWGWRSGESTLAALVPAQIKQRVAAIDLGESGAQDRLQWSRDALKLAGQRPLLGAGGGGWNALYGTVQTYAYFSTEVHNHFAQVWVEGGTLGFLAFLAVWVGAGWAYWRGRRTDAPLSAAAFVAAGGLGVHALIDFNLSLSAVSFMLWALFGLVAAGEPVPTGDGGAAGVVRPGRAAGTTHRGAAGPAHSAAGPSPWYLRLGIPVVCVALLSLTVSLRAGYGAGQRAAAALNAGDAERALVAFATACRYDPWTASFHIDLGQVYERQAGEAKTRELLAKARAEFERGVSLDPYNFQYRALYGRFLLRHGEADAGLAQLQKAIECRPALAAGYENLATASVLVGAAMADRGELDKARAYLQSVRTVAADMARRSTLVPAFVQRADYRLPASTPRLSLALGQASLLLGDTNTARQSLEAAVKDRQLQPEANLWLGAWALVAGQDPQPYLAQAGSIPDARGQAELIATRTRQLAAK